LKAVMKVARGVGNIELRDIEEPQPGPNQVKIQIKAAGICGTDIHIYKDEFRSRPPVVLGHEISGEIVDVGADVDRALIGKRVTSETYYQTCGRCMYCRRGQANLCLNRLSIGSGVNGGFTKYLIVPTTNIHELPENVDYRAGALTEPLACVVHGVLNNNTVVPGDVAVIAGPGAIGLLTLQVLKAAGAITVMLGTNVDGTRMEMARQLGADYTINVQEQSPDELIAEITQEGLGADVVYECSGAGPAAQQLLTLVRRRGRYVQVGLFGQPIAWDLDQVCYRELTVTGSNASVPSAWDKALKLLETGAVRTEPLITHSYNVMEWQQAFDTFDAKTGVKTLLTPVD
jgi:L-iditol 2-dehydrogenase